MLTRLVFGLGLMAAVPLVAAGQEAKYPQINTAVTWQVDPAWPQKPKDFQWGHVPGVAVDAKDNVYVFTRATPPVQVYDSSGRFLRAWGEKTISSAHHIKIDHEGNVWTSDIGYHVIEKYTPEGKLLLTIGTKGKAGRDEQHLNRPTDMAIAENGDVYVSDGYGNARVVVFDQSGKYLREWGELGAKPGMFSIPHAIALDSKGRVYVADRNNARVQVFDPMGKFIAEWKNLIVPWGFCMTPKDELWVCGSSPAQWRKDDSNLGVPPKDQIFMKFNTGGKLLTLFTVPKGIDGLERVGEVNWVHCIAADARGNLYLGDIKGKRAQKFSIMQP